MADIGDMSCMFGQNQPHLGSIWLRPNHLSPVWHRLSRRLLLSSVLLGLSHCHRLHWPLHLGLSLLRRRRTRRRWSRILAILSALPKHWSRCFLGRNPTRSCFLACIIIGIFKCQSGVIKLKFLIWASAGLDWQLSDTWIGSLWQVVSVSTLEHLMWFCIWRDWWFSRLTPHSI